MPLCGVAPLAIPRIRGYCHSVTFIPSREQPARRTDAIHARTTKREHTDARSLRLDTGEVAYTHDSLATREQLNRVRGRAAYVAATRGLHDTPLPSGYRGSLTADGMSLDATTSRNRLQPLQRAVALSDTYVSDDGKTVSDVRFARGTVRHDDGTVDAASTLLVAKTIHRKR